MTELPSVIYNLSGFTSPLKLELDGSSAPDEIDPNRVVFTSDDAPKFIGLYLSGSQWRVLTAALLNALPQTAGENWLDLYGAWVKGVENPMSICDMIVSCIQNDAGVQDALSDFLGNRGVADNSASASVGAGDNGNVVEGVGCDLDSLYGAAVALEDFIHAVALDLMEEIVNQATDGIAWARILDYLPFLGDLPIVDDINDFVDQLRTFGVNAFAVGYNQAIRQDNICDIFNYMCSDCELNALSELGAVYRVRAGVTIDPDAALETMFRLMLGQYTDTAFVAALQLLVVATLSAGAEIAGMVGVSTLNQIAKSGDPDTDWQIFCDPCTPTCSEYNFRDSTWDFESSQSLGGVWISGEGWRFVQYGANYSTAWEKLTFASNQSMRSWRIDLTFTGVRSTNARNVQFLLDGVIEYDYLLPDDVGDVSVVRENVPAVVFDEIRILVGQSGTDAENAYIRSFKWCPTPLIT